MAHANRLLSRIKRVLYQAQGEQHIATVSVPSNVWDGALDLGLDRAYQMTRVVPTPDKHQFEVWGRPVRLVAAGAHHRSA